MKFLPAIIGLLVLLADFASKYFTHYYLPLQRKWMWYPYGGIGVFKDFLGIEFSISHQINFGAAWGMLANLQVPLLYFRILLVIGLFVYTLFISKQRNRSIPLTLILSGALGNIIDYFLYGHVVDMLHFVLWGYDFPVFNIADSAIFIGIVWLLLLSWCEKAPVKKRRA